jgi:hypothetical protein
MKYYLILALALGFTACMNQESPTSAQTTVPQPGQVQLVAMNGMGNGGLNKISIQPSDSFTYAFNLDTAKSSIQEYFILQNTGDFDIKNVTFTTNNPQFYFSPSTIALLPPSKNSSILQVITLNVVHGTRLSGVGIDSLLPTGINIASAQLTATTTDVHGDSLKISQNATMKVFAELMNFDIYANGSTTPDKTIGLDDGPNPNFPEIVPDYELSGTVRIANTGNVPINFLVWSDTSSSPIETVVVQADSSGYVPAGTVVEAVWNGAITEPGKYQIDPYGRLVFHL